MVDDAQVQDAAKKIGEALEASHQGYLAYCRNMGKPGISFSRWQMFQIRWAFWLGKTGWAQRMILKALEKAGKYDG